MFAVLDVDQLAAVATGDVRDHKMLHRLIFRIVIVVGAARKPDPDAPVDFAVGAVDVLQQVIGDQQVAVVDGDVPLNGVPLQASELAVDDTHVGHLVMEALTQNGVVGIVHVQVFHQEVVHHPLLLAADIDQRHRRQAGHLQIADDAVRAAHVKHQVIDSALPFATHAASVLQDKAPFAVALQATGNKQRGARRHPHRAVDVIAHQICRNVDGFTGLKRAFEGVRPVRAKEILHVYRIARGGARQRAVEQRRDGQQRAGLKKRTAGERGKDVGVAVVAHKSST